MADDEVDADNLFRIKGIGDPIFGLDPTPALTPRGWYRVVIHRVFHRLGYLTQGVHMSILKLVLVGLLLGAGTGAIIATDAPQKVRQVIVEHKETQAIDRAKATSHVIYMKSPVAGPAGCSATAIGPHALLTASHCEKPTSEITVDGVSGIKVVNAFRDEKDHSILLLSGTKFDVTAKFVPRELAKGEFVFIWGNPGDTGVQFVSDLRTGKYVTKNVFDGIIVNVYDLPAQHGDSGSAIFDANGNIVDVLSIGGALKIPHYGDVANATGALKVAFDKTVLDQAAKF